jgi:hypothetical protein
MICFSCHQKLSVVDAISFRESCPHCFSDLHVCLNCKFFDPKSYNECREPIAESVRDKEKYNLCEFFQLQILEISNLSKEVESLPSKKSLSREELRAQAEALFSKPKNKK